MNFTEQAATLNMVYKIKIIYIKIILMSVIMRLLLSTYALQGPKNCLPRKILALSFSGWAE